MPMNISYDNLEQMAPPTLLLCRRDRTVLGALYPVTDLTVTWNLDTCQELSFRVYKELLSETLWNGLDQFKLIYIPEFAEYFDLDVAVSETEQSVKTITGKSLCEAELSQIVLYDIEINTESDISREDYTVAPVYDPEHPADSLLLRILNKAPHYSIGEVDAVLAGQVRPFSIHGKDIYAFLTEELSKELNCLVHFDSVHRRISLYAADSYGRDTSVFVDRENLATSISLNLEKDSVKNTYRIQGGDDSMTAAVAACNPNGTNYIYHFSDTMRHNMSDTLSHALTVYQELYDSRQQEYADNMHSLYASIETTLYLTSGMMPKETLPDTSATAELAKLTAETIGTISVQRLSTASTTTVTNAVLAMAKTLLAPGYLVTAPEASYSADTHTWVGRFCVTASAAGSQTSTSHTSDSGSPTDTAENKSAITLPVDENYLNYTKQRIRKSLNQYQVKSETTYDYTLYGLNPLINFLDAYQTCLDILIEMGAADANSNLGLSDLYAFYYQKRLLVSHEIQVREGQLKKTQAKTDTYLNIRNTIQKALDLRTFLENRSVWEEFCSFRREDSYQNDNYISDGLNDAELFKNAQDLMDTAEAELIQASEPAITMDASLNNLLVIPEFRPLVGQFRLGNWIRLACDGHIYKLRLSSCTLNYADLSTISVTFSNAVSLSSGIRTIRQTLSDIKQRRLRQSHVSSTAGSTENSEPADTSPNYDPASDATRNVTYHSNCLLGRSYDPDLGAYSDAQLKIIGNSIVFTTDNWATTQTLIGYHSLRDDSTSGSESGAGFRIYGLNPALFPGNSAATIQELQTELNTLRTELNALKNGSTQ